LCPHHILEDVERSQQTTDTDACAERQQHREQHEQQRAPFKAFCVGIHILQYDRMEQVDKERIRTDERHSFQQHPLNLDTEVDDVEECTDTIQHDVCVIARHIGKVMVSCHHEQDKRKHSDTDKE